MTGHYSPRRPRGGQDESVIDHMTVTATDLARSGAFYDGALAPLGFRRVAEYVDPEDEEEAGVEAIGYATERAPTSVWLVSGTAPTHNVHIAFRASDAGAVDRFYAAALQSGGRESQAPRRWEIYRPGYYGALVADPDGNLIEALISGPQSTSS
jgi:catechol 2,3-dioxygenase-like lactoylglutathione lyase family enzyme